MKLLCLLLAILSQTVVKEEKWPVVTTRSTIHQEEWPEAAKPLPEEIVEPSESLPEVPPEPLEDAAEKEPDKVVEKETIEFISAPWCTYCKTPEGVLTKAVVDKLPFKIRKVDADQSGYRGGIPAFRWKGKSKSWGFTGWYGLDHLVKEWERTSTLKSTRIDSNASVERIRRLSPSELQAFARVYRGGSVGVTGGNFWAHLQEPNHGFSASQLQGLSQSECERIHSAHHNRQITPFTKTVE